MSFLIKQEKMLVTMGIMFIKQESLAHTVIFQKGTQNQETAYCAILLLIYI